MMTRRIQRGATLVEALIAFLVLSLGMLGMARLQTSLRLDSDIARQRSEAIRLAQEDIERQRAFATLVATPNRRSYAGISSAIVDIDEPSNNTRYKLTRSIRDETGFKTANVTLSWPDRNGAPQQLSLDSIVAGSDPQLSAALSVVARRHPLRGVAGRSHRVPIAAKDLGDGRSVFKPVATGTVALVFSNASGRIIGRCNTIAPALRSADITISDVASCDAADAMLLSGVVRFSSGTVPDPALANDTPLALQIELALSGGSYPAAPECGSEARELPSLTASDRFVAYHCMVTPLAGRWSGSSKVVPQGWTIGTAASQYKVCRYSADQDGSGSIDNNAEHPRNYSQVEASLMQQNFLVIRGNQICPIAPVRGGSVFADLSTVQHQP